LAVKVNEYRKADKQISQQHIGQILLNGNANIKTITAIGKALDVTLELTRTSVCDVCRISSETLLDIKITNKLQIVRKLKVCPLCQTAINRTINQMIDA